MTQTYSDGSLRVRYFTYSYTSDFRRVSALENAEWYDRETNGTTLHISSWIYQIHKCIVNLRSTDSQHQEEE